MLEEGYHEPEAPHNPMPLGISVPVGMIATIGPDLLQHAARQTYKDHRDTCCAHWQLAGQIDQIEIVQSQQVQTAEDRRQGLEQIAKEDVYIEFKRMTHNAQAGFGVTPFEDINFLRATAQVNRLADHDPLKDTAVVETDNTLEELRANAQEAQKRAKALEASAILAGEIIEKTEVLSRRSRMATIVGGSIASLGLGLASIYMFNTIAKSQPEAAVADGTEIAGYPVGGVLAAAGVAATLVLAKKFRGHFAQRQARRQIAAARQAQQNA